ncbi:glycoside hydrolase family 75 protein, partial [Streptomyces echinoruber]
MRAPYLALAAAGASLLAPTSPPPAPAPDPVPAPSAAAVPRPAGKPAARHEDPVTAARLRARVRACVPVSRGRYRTDAHAPATVPVCGTRETVFWKADLDIDCDGRPTRRCNRRTDPCFVPRTAYRQSDGRPLAAERLPYIVVPAPSRIWNHRADGVRGGSVAAVVYRGRVRYAVVGDTGPRDLVGEASYATARALGIPPNPRHGGADSGVTYIVFKNSRVTPIQDPAAAAATGERLARRFLGAPAGAGHPAPDRTGGTGGTGGTAGAGGGPRGAPAGTPGAGA